MENILSTTNCIFTFDFVRKKPKSYCTIILKGCMNYRGGSRELELKLSGIRDVHVEKGYIDDEILEVLRNDLAQMFNTEVQPFTTKNIARGRKLCEYIFYRITGTEICRVKPQDI